MESVLDASILLLEGSLVSTSKLETFKHNPAAISLVSYCPTFTFKSMFFVVHMSDIYCTNQSGIMTERPVGFTRQAISPSHYNPMCVSVLLMVTCVIFHSYFSGFRAFDAHQLQ